MIVLGIEGTAHTLGIGIIEDEKILANVIKTYVPKEGGIHPREAAIHHSENFTEILKNALNTAKIDIRDIDLVSFSKGPGLGPCLRTVATAARTISLKLNIPIIGVNHSIAHLEIGKLTTGAEDPVMTYVSGGNTQIISYSGGRYRVFGETLDIGVGNLLDKFAREFGIPFPGGPKIEELAKKGKVYHKLPYSIRGLDISFSGILTAALNLKKNGATLEDLAYSLQETVFAMLTEVSERALAHLHKDEILLAGGVARNKRLREMMEIMGKERGASIHVPPPDLCVDNGAMIAYLGYLMYKNGIRMGIEDTFVDQKFRADSIDATWVKEKVHYKEYPDKPGAEALMEKSNFLGFPSIRKVRIKKEYRVDDLDISLRKERTKREAKLMHDARTLGINVPHIFDVDLENFTLEMEFIDGKNLREIFNSLNDYEKDFVSMEIGRYLAILHANGITHGDMTTSNIIYGQGKIYLIDFSMGEIGNDLEYKGDDLHLLKESFKSSHYDHMNYFDKIIESYRKNYENADLVIEKMVEIERRRRYS